MMDERDEHGLTLWPAPERNKQPILDVLLEILPAQGGRLLEIAAATGQHAVHFAKSFPHYDYIPSDYDGEHLDTLEARAKKSGLGNLKAPVRLDVTEEVWPLERVDVIYNANMVHIAPWRVAEGLFQGAARLLGPGGLLVTYGPYQRDGEHTSESNRSFDASLRRRNSDWGVRDLADLGKLASTAGFSSREPIVMPANNFLVVWDRI